ncbi:hypothetical protein PMAYCL1PPCAC_03503, partial [Pristionchus mayeri]
GRISHRGDSLGVQSILQPALLLRQIDRTRALLVEVDGGCVPVEHIPLEAHVATVTRQLCCGSPQHLAISLAAVGRSHVEILHVHELSDPRRVGQVVEQHARHLLHLIIDDDESAEGTSAEVARQRRLVDLHRRRHLLVLGQLPDHAHQMRHILSRRLSHCHPLQLP